MIDSLLHQLITDNADGKHIHPMQSDDFERPAFYAHWIAPVRYLLARRYIKHKKAVLEQFNKQGVYPVFNRDFIPELLARLHKKSWFSWLKRPKHCFLLFYITVFYPLLAAVIIFGSWQAHRWYENKALHQALADRIPYHSELLHRALVAKQYQNFELMEQYEQKADEEMRNIIATVPDKGNVRHLMFLALDNLPNISMTNAQIMMKFKDLNAEMDNQGIPYYLSPKLFNSSCSSFAPGIDKGNNEMFNTLADLFKEYAERGKTDLSTKAAITGCRTGIVTVYNVTERNKLDYVITESDKVSLPLFHVKRADRVPAADGALGLTFKSQGIGSLILRDQIDRFAEESILPALTFQGRSFIIPYWLQGYYDIEESITKNYQSELGDLFSKPESLRLLREAAKEMLRDRQHLSASRMQQTLQRSTPAGNSDGSILGGGLDVISGMMSQSDAKINHAARTAASQEIKTLSDSLLPSIEYHEAYHQIEKQHWKQPEWVPTLFKGLSDHGIESSLEELGAYLTQIVYTPDGQKVWLTKLLLFSLNSMTRDQPEFYASSMIFSAMRDEYLLQDIRADYNLDVDEKVRIYKTLSTLEPEELQRMAAKVFTHLFERPVVVLQ